MEENEDDDNKFVIYNEEEDKYKNNYNQHTFLNKLFWYYNQRGLNNIFFKQIFNLLSILFLVSSLFFIIFCTNYDMFINNNLYENYNNIEIFKYPEKIVWIAWITIICLIFVVYFAVIMLNFKNNYRIYNYFNNVLNYKNSNLEEVSWTEFLQNLIEKDKHILSKYKSNVNDIIMISMRKENYFIALYNEKIIKLPSFVKSYMYTHVFEWTLWYTTNILFSSTGELINFENLQNCFSDDYNNDNNHDDDCYLHGKFFKSTSFKLQKKFYLIGILMLLVFPFIQIAILLVFIFSYVEELKRSPGMLFTRSWSKYAEYKLRNFNEVSSMFQLRLAKSYNSADKYLRQFTSSQFSINLSQFFIFVISVILLPLIILSFYNDTILLLPIFPFKRNLIFVLGILTTFLTYFKVFLPSESYSATSPNENMTQLLNTLNLPVKQNTDWIKNAHRKKIRNIFIKYFPYKINILLKELIAVIMVPIIFIFYMPGLSLNIIKYLYNNTMILDHKLGTIVKYSNITINEKYMEHYISNNAEKVSLSSSTNLVEKLFSSVINFKENYSSIIN